MSFIQVITLALVQGITEFLPISSSGHLILGSWLFDWPDQGIVFDIAVHVGTLAAVLVYFRREWIQLLTGLAADQLVEVDELGGTLRARTLALLIVVGTVPIAIGGLLMKDSVEANFRTPDAVGWLLIGTAAALLVGEYVGSRVRTLPNLKLPDVGLIGLAQILAVFPGISRSGVTMVIGLAVGMTRDSAARFSMLLATPAIAGAGLLIAIDALDGTDEDWGAAALGAVISAITAYLVIAGLMRLLRNGSFRPFAVYCAVAGVGVVVARALGA
ncbi:MAG: undecaprenyl-diphosphate phosphatase [Dehalococcoidia bacterium]|jgi:undecaprenyl-diphosphatase|nr:undecaprenyl-diphosphatase [Chloroflexota bacterium]MDP6055635.1 undecaprenyl-diphosphate phosphatase [Dehalococcoidia bacterium]MDP7090249.1 undecaprenyl-diphosphate phosphatase [Dehalococcoidia bacterium]MDP7261283.1 undecaprenyl-diphosphate phosphatase [Dehalococcoidia bacterium]MDP7485409.1 undecaprenyl-diphosphate phosphatase [Dehalococcoidia bacterium]|tara:strand:+ start:6619 stop:7437 length:819 start_codon:yes stop_codon:yes gene_type:complete